MKFKQLAMFLSVCAITSLPMAKHISFGLNKQAQTTANLNLRKGPSTKQAIITTIKKGSTVEVLEVSGDWSKIKYGNKTGYSSRQYLKDLNTSTSNPGGGNSGSTSTSTKKMEVTATNLNVRSTPSTSGKILGKLSKGTRIDVMESSNGWSKFKYGSSIGYCSNDYLKAVNTTDSGSNNNNSNNNNSNSGTTTTKKMEVTATNLNVRSTASTSGKILGKLPKGSKVDVYEIKNNWGRISYNGKTAYVSADYLKDVSSASESFVANLNVAKQTNQIITVVGTGGYNVNVILHEKNSDGKWQETLSTKGTVGSKGIGTVSEGSKKTPEGVHGFTFAFGNASNPGTKFEYRKINSNNYWVDDPNSKYYNQWVDVTTVNKDWNSAEHLSSYQTQYKYAIALDYNTNPVVPGKGSAFFLHVGGNGPTAGCVAVPEQQMVNILKRLSPGAKIVISKDMSSISKY